MYIYIYIDTHDTRTHIHTKKHKKSGEGRPDISRIFRDLLGGPTEPDARHCSAMVLPSMIYYVFFSGNGIYGYGSIPIDTFLGG